MRQLTLPTAKAGDSWFDDHCAASEELASYTISPSVSSRVPHGTFYLSSRYFGFVFQSLAQDVLCSIRIPVVMRSALWAIPFADAQILCQWTLIAADGAGLTRRIERIDFE